MSRETYPSYLSDLLKEKEELLFKAKEEDAQKTDLRLECSWIQFHLGHVRKCEELLKEVTFHQFDVKQLIVENNVLICQFKDPAVSKDTLQNFGKLFEKVQGLPQDGPYMELELLVSYNYSYQLFSAAKNPSAKFFAADAIHNSACVLIRTFLKMAKPFRQERKDQSKDHSCTVQNVFTDGICCKTLEAVSVLLGGETGLSRDVLPSVHLCCVLLAILWMSTEQVDSAKRLLKMIEELPIASEKEARGSSPECGKLWSASHITLVRLPLLHSSYEQFTLSKGHSLDEVRGRTLAMMAKVLLAFCHYSTDQFTQALELLTNSSDFSGQLLLHFSHIKGSILYEMGDIDQALALFCHCLKLSKTCWGNSGHLAVFNNYIGCCYATKGKPYTAIAKFREAFECDSTKLEPLFNTSVQYRQLGEFEAEIQTLRFLSQALTLERTQERPANQQPPDLFLCPTFKQRLTSFSGDGSPAKLALCSSLRDETLTVEFVTWTLANRCNHVKRYAEAAEAFLDLLALLTEKPTAFREFHGQTPLPTPSAVYCESAAALLNAGCFDDAVTVCDRALTVRLQEDGTPEATKTARIEANTVDRQGSIPSGKSSLKRPREIEDGTLVPAARSSFPIAEVSALLLHKSEALLHLNQPVEALMCIDRVLRMLECVPSHGRPGNEEQQRTKKRKLLSGEADSGVNSGGPEREHGDPKLEGLTTLKSQAYNNKALILVGLNQPCEALQQLHQSLECSPDNTEAVFNHTLLLKKLGKGKEAAYNWLTFRGLDRDQHGRVKQKLSEPSPSSRLSPSQVSALDKSCLAFCNNNPTHSK